MSVSIKTPDEIEKMRVAGRLAAEVLEMVTEHVAPGVTTDELDQLCHRHIVGVQQARPAPLNYPHPSGGPAYPKSVCTSLNNVICHGIPDNKRLEHGDILNIDVTVEKNGYHGDTSKMFLVGRYKPHAKRIVEVTREAMMRGIDVVRPGAKLSDIGRAIQGYVQAQHYSVVRDYCGHGIGAEFHEDPQVVHYYDPKNRNNDLVLEPGMCFTIEPMVNAGSPKTKLLRDGWTVKTIDRKLSAQWEHTILVTDQGHEILTLRNEERGAPRLQ